MIDITPNAEIAMGGLLPGYTFTVFGQHGEFEVDGQSGMVLTAPEARLEQVQTPWTRVASEMQGYAHIERIDTIEFFNHFGHAPTGRIDILSLGYWTYAGKYEPPCYRASPDLDRWHDDGGPVAD